MKTLSEENITRDLELLQSHLSRIERLQKTLSTCQADMAEMQARIQKLGKPSYKNDAAVDELARTKQRLELCASEAAETEQELTQKRAELQSVLSPVCTRAVQLLNPILERRIKTITAAMMPFCDSERSAMNAAQWTDAYRSAQQAIARIAQARGGVRHARRLIRIFEEALKKDGDLLQFLAPIVEAKETVEATAP